MRDDPSWWVGVPRDQWAAVIEAQRARWLVQRIAVYESVGEASERRAARRGRPAVLPAWDDPES